MQQWINQRASLFWLITFFFRGATAFKVIHIEAVAPLTRQLSCVGVKFISVSSVVFAHGSEENDNGIDSLNFVAAFSDRHLL